MKHHRWTLAFFILSFIFIKFSFAVETVPATSPTIVQGKLSYTGESKLQQISLGDSFVAVLDVWPWQPVDLTTQNAKELIGTLLLNYFYVVDILSVVVSANNQDVIQIKMQLILYRNFLDTTLQAFNWHNHTIPVYLDGLKPVPGQEKTSSLIFLERPALTRWYQISPQMLMVLSICILGLFVFGSRKLYKRLQVLKFWREQKKCLFQQIKEAQYREDFEKLYQMRPELGKFFDLSYPAIHNLFSTIALFQYKRQWSENDLFLVRTVCADACKCLDT